MTATPGAGPEPVAQAFDVTRRYGPVVALDQVSLDIRAGQLLGLLGPNGAGKSTLINLFVGVRRANSGRVEVFGADPREPATRRSIGMTPQETGLPPTLRVREVVGFVGAHYPNPVGVGELLERFGLSGLERRQTGGSPAARSAGSRSRWHSWADPAWSSSTSPRPARRRRAKVPVGRHPRLPRNRGHGPPHEPLPRGGGGARHPGRRGRARPDHR